MTTYNTTIDSASITSGVQEVRKITSLTPLRALSQKPDKDQRWVEGVLRSWEAMGDDDFWWGGGRGLSARRYQRMGGGI